ncbi:MAG: histidine phosphatase family protein [Pseudomonadales bacterium]|nr:histidine phosphatase family protein [Pseudomonadales bacterium]MCP5358012.1 histidine phosphatase family protein [Pseudomonadales bacterium]
MKTLYLLRHAKSSWANPGQKDYDRPLNDRGMHDTPEMAARLRERGARVDLVVSSPAVRALSTATLMCEGLGIDPGAIVQDRQIYLAGSPKLMQIVSFMDESRDAAMLVAHNPALTDLANDLARAGIDNIPTCGLVAISLPVEHWAEVTPGAGQVLFFDFPKNPD